MELKNEVTEVIEKTALEIAKEKLGDLGEALKKQATEKGWDIDIEEGEDLDTPPTMPKFRLKRRANVGDAIRAEQMAITQFGNGQSGFTPTVTMLLAAKVCLLGTFDGKYRNLPELEDLDEGFFTNILGRFSKYLVSY